MIRISQIKGFAKAKEENLEFEDLKKFILKNRWSPFSFKNDHRNIQNSVGTDLLVVDIDEGCSLENALRIFKEYKHIIGTTKSHQIEKNGKTADRFRVILFLDKRIEEKEIYDNFWEKMHKDYSFADPKCKSFAHMYFPCKEIMSVNENEKLIEV